jgi:hypothetical protein
MADLGKEMRILRLDLDTGDEIDLHPYVTALGGLGPGLQRRVADQLARIARGDVEGLRGLVEAHGMLIEVEPAPLSALHLPADADVVVRAEQLPGARVVGSATPVGGAGRARDDELRVAESELQRVAGEIAQVLQHVERSTLELDDARRHLDEFAITAHESAVSAVEQAEDLARRRLQPDVAAGVPAVAAASPEDVRREQLAALLDERRRHHADREAFLDEERLELLQLLEQLEAEREALDQLRAEVDAQAGPGSEMVGSEDRVAEPEPGPALADRADMMAVHAAIREVITGPPDAPMVPSLPAAALADQVAAHRERRREWERELVERGLDPATLRERLAAARRVEASAAEAAKPKTVSPDDEREIERLRDIVVENAEKRENRRYAKEATRLYEESSAELEQLLEKYGFPTYTAYVMGRTAPTIDVEARRRHEDAVQMVANLERELEEASAAIADDPHGRMLRAERDQLWAAAEELLGGPVGEDLEEALRNLRVPGSVEFTAPDRLRQLLRGLGVDVSDATTNASLLEVADRWYTEAKEAHEAAEAEARAALEPHGADPHRGIHLPGDPEPLEPDTPADLLARQEALVADLLERSLHLDGELTKHETAFDREAAEIAALEAEVVMLDEQRAASRAQPGPAIDPQAAERAALDATLAADPMVQTAREQASLTAARLDRHHRAVERVDALHAEIGRARATERALTTQRDALHAQLANLRSGSSTTDTGTPLPSVEWTLTEEGVGPIEWYLLGRVASLRSVSAAGSVPLVLDDAFRGLPAAEIVSLCGVLARIGETVQVIYLGDEPAVAAWAEQQGLDLAAAVRPGQPAI